MKQHAQGTVVLSQQVLMQASVKRSLLQPVLLNFAVKFV